MPRECTVCNHPDVFTINERLVGIGGKQSLRNIAKQFDVNYQAVNRHKQHIPELLLKASQAMEIAEADGLIDQVRDLQQRTLAILDKAEDDTDLRTALSAISQARSNLELLGKLAGELQQEGSTNLYLNAEWIELKMAIVEALKPHPQALRDVSVALQGAKSNGSN